jgi:hypothetical protein
MIDTSSASGILSNGDSKLGNRLEEVADRYLGIELRKDRGRSDWGAPVERGALTPAVVRILKRSKKPLRAADIYNALVAQGFLLRAKSRRKSSEFGSTRCQESGFLVADCFRPSEGRGKYISKAFTQNVELRAAPTS